MIVQYLVATACLLFVLSLPLGKLPVASTLRRWAAVLFLLAFLPSVFYGIISSPRATHETSTTAPIGCSIEAVLGFVVLSLLAYGILEIRKRLRPGKSADAWTDYVGLRTSGKKPVKKDSPSRLRGDLLEDVSDEP